MFLVYIMGVGSLPHLILASGAQQRQSKLSNQQNSQRHALLARRVVVRVAQEAVSKFQLYEALGYFCT
jgi:hypothetical protein